MRILKRILRIFLALAGLILLCAFYGFFIEPERLVTRKVVITSPLWTGAPLKIGLVSDVHVGGRKVYAPKVERLVKRLNALEPDIILLAGDYTTGTAPMEARDKPQIQGIETGHAALGGLHASMGVYAVLGNHDFQYGAEHVQTNLEAGGIHFLDNRSIVIEDRFCLYGLADGYFGHPTAEGFLSCPKDISKIGFSHNPDSLFLLPTGSALLLAGHTHGGQVNIPLLGRRFAPIKSGKEYAYGKSYIGITPVFVTAGIGLSQISARFRTPPEVVLVTLKGED